MRYDADCLLGISGAHRVLDFYMESDVSNYQLLVVLSLFTFLFSDSYFQILIFRFFLQLNVRLEFLSF